MINLSSVLELNYIAAYALNFYKAAFGFFLFGV